MATRKRISGTDVDTPPRLRPIDVKYQEVKRVYEPPLALNVTLSDEAVRALIDERRKSLDAVFTTLHKVKIDLDQFFPRVPAVLPRKFIGELVQQNGAPGIRLSVIANKPALVDGAQRGRTRTPSPTASASSRSSSRLCRCRPTASISS